MGWPWFSTGDVSTPTTSSKDSISSDLSHPNPVSPHTSTSADTSFDTSSSPSDTELEAFLSSIRPSNSRRPSRQIPGFPTLDPSTAAPPPSSSSSSPQSSSDTITPANLYPTTLSCRSAFDSAFYCASLGGQFTNIYRYGSLRRCSHEWADFWWCVRTNRGFMSDEEREATVLRRAREREVRLYRGNQQNGGAPERGGSSEDVWEARRRVVSGAFQGDFWGAIEENERAEREERGTMADGAVGREV